MVVVGRQHLDCLADALDDRGPDEHAGEIALDPGHRQAGFERLALTPVCVAQHRAVEHTQRR